MDLLKPAGAVRFLLIPSLILSLVSAVSPALAQESSAHEKGYFSRHLWHWAIALGTSFADNKFEDVVEADTDPLFLADPPGIDKTVRDAVAGEAVSKNILLRHRARTGALLSLGAVIFANVGRKHARRWIADDGTGLAELWFFDKGASGLVKNIVGRQRPEIEFIDENEELTPLEKEEEEAKASNHQSFYSGATSRQFSLMSYADRIVAGRVKKRAVRAASFIGFYSYAAYVGYSRLREDEHYLTDVVAGAAAGILIGRGFYNAHHHAARAGGAGPGSRPEPRVRLQSIGPADGGVSLLFSVRL